MENAVNKNTAACCSKRAAEGKRVPGWLDSALLLQLEEKLLDMFDGQSGFGRGEDDGDVINTGLVLRDYDVAFVADINLCPVAWGDGVGGHAYTVSFKVRGGKVVSYEVRGRGKYEVFVKILPHGRDVKNS